MSFKILKRCWNANITNVNANAKIVLIALADKADDHGVCWPSYQCIADMCSVSRTSVIRAIEHLEQEQYVISLGRGGRKLPNTYFVTIDLTDEEIDRIKCEHPRLVEVQRRLNDTNSDTVIKEESSTINMRNDTNSDTVSHINSDYIGENSTTIDTVSEPEKVPIEAKTVPTVDKNGANSGTRIIKESSDSLTIKESKSLKDKEKSVESIPPKSEHQAIVNAMAKICIVDLGSCLEKDRALLTREAKLLRTKCKATHEDIYQFHNWWYKHFWIGRDKKDSPRISQVRQCYPQFLAWRDPPEPESTPTPGWQTDAEPPPVAPATNPLREKYWPLLKAQTAPATFADLWQSTDIVAENGHYVLSAPSPSIAARLDRFGVPHLRRLIERAEERDVEIVIRKD